MKIVNMMADDVKLLEAKEVLEGKAELGRQWIGRNLPVSGNLRTDVVSSNADAHYAYEAGIYKLDVAFPSQKPFEASGNYTFIWEKQADNSWKISFMQMEPHYPEALAK